MMKNSEVHQAKLSAASVGVDSDIAGLQNRYYSQRATNSFGDKVRIACGIASCTLVTAIRIVHPGRIGQLTKPDTPARLCQI